MTAPIDIAKLRLGNEQLASGNFLEGWANIAVSTRLSEMWSAKYGPQTTPRPGSTVGLVAHLGIGDELMFARFVPQLRALGPARIVYVTRNKTGELFRRMDLFDDVLTPEDKPILVDHTYLIDRLPPLLGMSDVSHIPASLPCALYRARSRR